MHSFIQWPLACSGRRQRFTEMIDLHLTTPHRPLAPRELLVPVIRLVTSLSMTIVNGKLVAVPAPAR